MRLAASVAGEAPAPTETLDKQLAALIVRGLAIPGLHETLGQLHRTAWLARDRLSVDAWRTLNQLPTKGNHAPPRRVARERATATHW